MNEIERAMMDKLLPCPFCGGEATISDGGYSGEKFLVRCRELSCPAASGFIRKTHDEAIAAWNRRAQPENEPLTLDELGQLREARIPVWMGRAKEWIFVAAVADVLYAQVWYVNAKGFKQTVLYHHEKFYRSKPKEE